MKQSLSLYELNNLIRRNFEENFSTNYWIIAEISELRKNANGHCYLEITESKGGEVIARAKANIWAYNFNRISTYFETVTNSKLQAGIKILIEAKVTYHPLYGLSLTVQDIDPNYTLGEKQRLKLEAIERLKKDGTYELNKTLHLPTVIQKIAIISSSKSAGYEDFVKHLINNNFGYKFQLEIFQSSMQGANVEKDIIKALYKIYEKIENYDVVILIRGGGATTDLDAFDNYNLASHLAQFPIPILTGIGHQRDETIVDLVAHSKLKTPTAVSTFILDYNREYEKSVENYYNKIIHLSKNIVNKEKERIRTISNVIEVEGVKILSSEKNKIQRLQSRVLSDSKNKVQVNKSLLQFLNRTLALCVKKPIQNYHNKIEGLEDKIKRSSLEKLKYAKQGLDSLERIILLLSPKNILKRGYSISYDKNNKIIKQSSQLEEKEVIKTVGYNYEIESSTINFKKTKNENTDSQQEQQELWKSQN